MRTSLMSPFVVLRTFSLHAKGMRARSKASNKDLDVARLCSLHHHQRFFFCVGLGLLDRRGYTFSWSRTRVWPDCSSDS